MKQCKLYVFFLQVERSHHDHTRQVAVLYKYSYSRCAFELFSSLLEVSFLDFISCDRAVCSSL